jgi:lipid II isoglutaminyl synthase (glutamine-hydrolysing)
VREAVTIVHVYPQLLGTYGDRGNVLALVHRARGRGIAVRVVDVGLDEALPRTADLYVLGGGEDAAQLLAARCLLADERVAAVLAGAPTLAVCAGLQLLARSFLDGDGRPTPGLGLLDVDCGRLPRRAVGEVVSEPVELPGAPTLTGYENHRGDARLGPAARPLGRIVTGVGNGDGRTEGAQQGTVLATYLHGPVLVRNPWLADELLSRAVGPLAAYDDGPVDELRAERLAAADPRRRRGSRLLHR